jgi:hypothetical protein
MATISFNTNGVMSKVPVLSNNLIPYEHIPQGEWKDILDQSAMNTDYQNNTGRTQLIYVRTNAVTSNSQYLRVSTRKIGTTDYFHFDAAQIANDTGKRYETWTLVPDGWEWYYNLAGLTKSAIQRIFMFT